MLKRFLCFIGVHWYGKLSSSKNGRIVYKCIWCKKIKINSGWE
jgi:hypothetical protein